MKARLLRASLLSTLAVLATPGIGYAAPPPAPEQSALPHQPQPATDTPTATRTAQIVALIEGNLDPSVDASELLVIDLANPSLGDGGQRLVSLFARLGAPVDPDGVPADDRPADDRPADDRPADEWLAYQSAVLAYLHLAPEARAERLATHAVRREAWLAQEKATVALDNLLAKDAVRAANLEAYLSGRLDTAVDPSGLLTMDLAHGDEVGLSITRRNRWLPDPQTPEATGDRGTTDTQTRLDIARRRFLALTPDERTILSQSHRDRVVAAETAVEPEQAPEPEPEVAPDPVPPQQEVEGQRTAQDISDAEAQAQSAAAQQELALQRARFADTKAKAAFEEENARLLGVKGAQALYAAEINRRKVEGAEFHATATQWRRRVDELRDGALFEAEKATQSDPMYGELRADLAALRERLRDELRRIRNLGSEVPVVGTGLDLGLVSEADRKTLVALRQELLEQHSVLAQLEGSVGWELAEALRNDVVLLNRTRLALLETASPELRSSVTGFGAAGVDQAKREAAQISLELGFHALRIPRYPSYVRAKLRDAAIPVLIGVGQLVLVLVAFVWWRRRGRDIMGKLDNRLREQQPKTAFSSAAVTLVWYLRRVRRPLEPLLVLWLSVDLIGNVNELPEVHLLWITAVWVLAGLAVIQFVDALAARETRRFSRRDNSKLRIHSLHVVGINIIAVGLVLSLTSATVGKGAIYSWVLSTCWFLSFPVAVYLVHKWRPIIYDQVETQPEQTPFTAWVVAQKSGAVSYVAATAGAGYLLGRGVSGWVMRQLAEFEATRRVLAYLFRREVAKQAAASQADSRFQKIDDRTYEVFDPEAPVTSLVEKAASKELMRAIEVAEAARPTLSAIVGERGAGKSVFIRRLKAHFVESGENKVRVLSCPEEGFEALEAEIAKLTPNPELRGEALCAELRTLGEIVIAVDDLQRLIVPAVNGLTGLDRFTNFARDVGGKISWLVTIGSASWHYIRRARGERIFFEHVISLPRWPEETLGELLQAHCALAKISPSFDGLVVPRPANAPIDVDENKAESGYYRLLWDFSRGNPAVALHAFRESLFVDPDKNVVVRLFKEPAPEEIEDLSPSLLFVLRSVVQLELAMPAEVESATQFPRNDVDDALRFCVARGYLEPFQGGVRLTWPWYRTITTVLQRQHLLSTL